MWAWSAPASPAIDSMSCWKALSKGVDVTVKDDKLYIRVSVVVGYGTQYTVIATNVIEM